ncbi:MAG: FAD-binding oxidoreductase [Methanothrix sp.]|nr:FAD-binding oxidoreductase [Methanothrix sp.]
MNLIDDLKEIVGLRATASIVERLCYASDASQVQGLPEYVVRPLNVMEVSRILRLCYERGIAVTPRGAGTGLAGGATPLRGGVVLDMSGMNRILEIDIENQQVIIEPGVVQEQLNCALLPHGFFFPPDPCSSAACTVGGMISNNSSGMRCVKYGTTRNYVLDLEVVLADGRVIRTGSKVLKSAAGYDLTRLFVGSEGTLGIITQAGLKIVPLPPSRKLVMASFASAQTAGQAVIKVFSGGITPSACEILDRTTLQVLKRCDPNLALPDDGDVILFEVDGMQASIDEEARLIEAIPAMKYGHIGDGNLHVALFIDVMDEEQWRRLRLAADGIHRAAIELGGTVSSEHGIGLARAQYMREQVGVEAQNVMRSIKKALDPKGILNPGKLDL